MVFIQNYNNYDIVIGLNNKENIELITKMMKNPYPNNIMFLYLRYITTPYCFIIGPNPDNFIIYKAAYYLKNISIEKKSSNVIINYTNIINVKHNNKYFIVKKANTLCI